MKNCKLNNRGSILITVLILGTILVSSYFFFATRQLSKSKAQAETIEYQNQKAYLESYVDYLISKTKTNPAVMDNVVFDDGLITVDELSNETDIITGSLDLGESVDYEISGDKSFTIEWNRCDNNYKADVLIKDGATENTQPHSTNTPSCPASPNQYDDTTSPITISGNSFSINAIDAPFHYRITVIGDTQVKGKEWYLKAHLDMDHKKKITIERMFERL